MIGPELSICKPTLSTDHFIFMEEMFRAVKKSYSPLGVPNRHQECKGMQRHDQYFLHMELLSYDNKPHNIRM